jgi:hypothetical protein
MDLPAGAPMWCLSEWIKHGEAACIEYFTRTYPEEFKLTPTHVHNIMVEVLKTNNPKLWTMFAAAHPKDHPLWTDNLQLAHDLIEFAEFPYGHVFWKTAHDMDFAFPPADILQWTPSLLEYKHLYMMVTPRHYWERTLLDPWCCEADPNEESMERLREVTSGAVTAYVRHMQMGRGSRRAYDRQRMYSLWEGFQVYFHGIIFKER